MALVWAKFALCAALIGVAGAALTHYGDAISGKTGLSRNWAGLILLATATSLPELFTGISASSAGSADIAIGDVLGSCVFNLVMLAGLDAITRGEPLFRRLDQGHILTAGFGVVLIGFVGASLLLSPVGVDLKLLHIGGATPILLALYLVATRAVFTYEQQKGSGLADAAGIAVMPLQRAIVGYLAAAAVVAGAGIWLPHIGIEIAEVMGWRTSFVGTLFIAAATSLPELAVTVSAVRMGARDLAAATLLGSNLFNMLVLAVDDAFYLPGPILAAASRSHAVTAFAAVVMSGIVIVALLLRPAGRPMGTVGWASWALLIAYVLGSYAVFMLS